MLFDKNKRLIASGDCHPHQYAYKLDGLEYVLKAQVRHEDKEQLEKLEDVLLILHQKLEEPVTLDLFANKNHAVIGGMRNSQESKS